MENFKKYTKEEIKDIEYNHIKITNGSWHRYLLRMLPDYSNVKFSFINTKGGLGYTAPWEVDGDRLKHEGLRYKGIPTPEIWTHELWHYFTNPALVEYKNSIQNKTICHFHALNFTEGMIKLYEGSKKFGYSPINGVSVHDNLNEFVVNITNERSVDELKRIGIFDEYFIIQNKWMKSIGGGI